jgi:hypothetical protein
MKRMGKTLALLGPMLLLAGLPTAQAHDPRPYQGVGGAEGWLCRTFGLCWWIPPPNGGLNNPDPKPVPEPEMLGLFAVGSVSAALAAYRRRRK